MKKTSLPFGFSQRVKAGQQIGELSKIERVVNRIFVNLSNSKYFNMHEDLKALIVNISGIRKEKVTSEARLFYDLGIYGHDGVELIIAYGKEFSVDVSNFMAADYFEPEGDTILPSIIRLITGKAKPIMKELTVSHLEKGILAGKLDENVINPPV